MYYHSRNRYIGQPEHVCALFDILDEHIPIFIKTEIEKYPVYFCFDFTKSKLHIYKNEPNRTYKLKAAKVFVDHNELWFTRVFQWPNNYNIQEKYEACASRIDIHSIINIDINKPIVILCLKDLPIKLSSLFINKVDRIPGIQKFRNYLKGLKT